MRRYRSFAEDLPDGSYPIGPGVRKKCINSGGSLTTRRTGQVDPDETFGLRPRPCCLERKADIKWQAWSIDSVENVRLRSREPTIGLRRSRAAHGLRTSLLFGAGHLPKGMARRIGGAVANARADARAVMPVVRDRSPAQSRLDRSVPSQRGREMGGGDEGQGPEAGGRAGSRGLRRRAIRSTSFQTGCHPACRTAQRFRLRARKR